MKAYQGDGRVAGSVMAAAARWQWGRAPAERGMAPALPDERLITRADLFIRMIQMRCN